jgi:carboxyl-terminal processing protease
MPASRFSRRTLCAAAFAACGSFAFAREPPHDITYIDDFDELWRTLGERYCFFHEKQTDWDRVRALYRPMAVAADSDEAFTDLARRVLAELYDAHTHLSNPPDGSPRWPLYDLMVVRRADSHLRDRGRFGGR